MDFIGEMVRLRDEISGLADGFGVPTIRSVIIRKRSDSSYTYTEIYPKPHVEVMAPAMIASFGDSIPVKLELDDLKITISRRYSADELTGTGVDLIVDGQLFGDRVVGGYEVERVPGMDISEKTLVWELYVRRKSTSRR